jgi:hypothetical protein
MKEISGKKTENLEGEKKSGSRVDDRTFASTSGCCDASRELHSLKSSRLHSAAFIQLHYGLSLTIHMVLLLTLETPNDLLRMGTVYGIILAHPHFSHACDEPSVGNPYTRHFLEPTRCRSALAISLFTITDHIAIINRCLYVVISAVNVNIISATAPTDRSLRSAARLWRVHEYVVDDDLLIVDYGESL